MPLIVKHKPIFVEKNVSPGSLVLANSTASLTCKYSGYPSITITWVDPNGVQITEGVSTTPGPNGEWIESKVIIF